MLVLLLVSIEGEKMLKIKNFLKDNKLLLFVLFIGFFARLFYIGNVPGNSNIHGDEAFAGYEAYSMLYYGHDSRGYCWPVYLKTWGSGMSVMQSLCMIPFVYLFGLNSFAIRLPQAIWGCLSLVAFWYVCKKIGGERFGLFAAAIYAIMPWEIMMSRWALDCNYLPSFLIIALALLIKSVDNHRFFLLSMLMFGLSLYCYAAPWAFMPLIILGPIIYLFIVRKIKVDKYHIIGMLIFVLLCVPLFLFILVNMDVIPEIRTRFISVPRLSLFRANEFILSPKAFIESLYDTLVTIIEQDDGRTTNTTPMFGLYYKFSLVFVFVGIEMSLYRVIKARFKDEHMIMWFQFVAAVIFCGTIESYFTRINIIHVPMTFFLAYGLWEIYNYFGSRIKFGIIILYSMSFLAFMGYYFTYYDETLSNNFYNGLKYAVDYIQEVQEGDEKVYVITDIAYPLFLFYSEMDTDEFIATAVYTGEENAIWDSPTSFGYYIFSDLETESSKEELKSGDIYIAATSDVEAIAFIMENCEDVQWFSNYAVGIVD